jgi:hypothetical protein
VIATIIPITTNTMIAACIQIQVGDIGSDRVPAPLCEDRSRRATACSASLARRVRHLVDYRG